MNSLKRVLKRDHRIRLIGIGLLALVAVVLVPVLVWALLIAPKATAGLAMAAMLPGVVLRSPYGDGGGGGADDFEAKVLNGVNGIESEIKRLKGVANDQERKIMALQRRGIGEVTRPGQVSEGCARHFCAVALLAGMKQGLIRAGDWAEGMVKDVLGIEGRTALTSTDIPLPQGYGNEVVELMSVYGAARKYGTVYPLSASIVSLPRLKTSPAFTLVAQSATSELSPQTELVTFTAQKFGGFVRIPAEVAEDSSFELGQFLARYAAREMARAEDHNFFVGTGANSGVNGSVKGICESVIDNSKVTQMGSGKTKYSDATLANIRALRATVDEAALSRGAYYCHTSFESLFSGLNTAGDKPYVANGIQGASLDGYPIRWVPAMPAYSTSANVSKVFMLFGDLSYHYLAIRRGVTFDTSKEAGFTTDEIVFRALERFTIGLMATGAVGGLQTAAS